MKFLALVLFLNLAQTLMAHDVPVRIGSGSISYATEGLLSRRGELSPPQGIFDIKELNRVLLSDLMEQNKNLREVKYFLLNGEVRLARALLTKLAYTKTKLKPVVKRYLAILAFIEGDFAKSYEHLKISELQELPHFSRICVLQTLNQIVLNKIHDIEDVWGRCKLENTGNFREEGLVWIDTLLELKLNPRPGVTKIPFRSIKLRALDLDQTKMMMKLALYLNQEDLLVQQIPSLDQEQIQDTEIRELVGQALFRKGSLAKAYRFIEDLKTPNAENIKGNLYLLREKYELAYAQFKLALEQKKNSQNAMERLLPLAWLLGDWENGSKYALQVIASPQTQINKLTLLAAFLVQKGDYMKARDLLDSVARESSRGTALEVSQLAGFTALMENNPSQINKQATLSCKQYDLMSCWVLLQMGQWETFPLTIRRGDKVPVKSLWEKLTKDELDEPLKEKVFVNQIDIEEMDDKLIQLIPKT